MFFNMVTCSKCGAVQVDIGIVVFQNALHAPACSQLCFLARSNIKIQFASDYFCPDQLKHSVNPAIIVIRHGNSPRIRYFQRKSDYYRGQKKNSEEKKNSEIFFLFQNNHFRADLNFSCTRSEPAFCFTVPPDHPGFRGFHFLQFPCLSNNTPGAKVFSDAYSDTLCVVTNFSLHGVTVKRLT